MLSSLIIILCYTAALGSGLVAGIFFAFSTFIMAALARLKPDEGIAAMNAINVVILRSLFMPVFFGTALVSLVLVALALWQWEASASPMILGGALLYLVGVILTTGMLNVPLNNRLAAVEHGTEAAHEVWTHYLRIWTRWNHIRTLASAIACVLFMLAATAIAQ